MDPINALLGTTPTVIVDGLTVLAFPPAVRGGNVSFWNSGADAVPAFDLEVWSASSVTLTLAELFGGALHLGVIADDDVESVTHGSNLMTIVAHGLHTGDGPIRFTTSGTLPAGLALATDYYVIKLSADTFSLATTLANALAGTAIDITGNGTGTHTLADVATTKRMHFHSCGLLGNAADGTIVLTTRRAYNVRVDHRPNVLMYWLSATLSTPVAVYAAVYPVQSA